MKRGSSSPAVETDSPRFRLHSFVNDPSYNRKDKDGRPLSKFGIFPAAFVAEMFPDLTAFEKCIMVVLFERLFDSLKQFNEATGVWNPAVRIAIAEFADITDFHPNTITKGLLRLEGLELRHCHTQGDWREEWLWCEPRQDQGL